MNFDLKDVFAGTPVSNKSVQTHLSRTYVLLLAASAAAAVGATLTMAVPTLMWIMSGTVGRFLCTIATVGLGYVVQTSTVRALARQFPVQRL
jgi:actin-like ATPase involved in cell morphogenesis